MILVVVLLLLLLTLALLVAGVLSVVTFFIVGVALVSQVSLAIVSD